MISLTKISPDWRERWSLLIEKIRRIQTPDEEARLLDRLTAPTSPYVLAFANAHAMNSLAASSAFFDALSSADMVLRDGSGMATLYKLLRLEPGLNLNGTDLIPQLIARFDGRKIALFGTQNPYLEKSRNYVAEHLASSSSAIVAHGFLEAGDYASLAREHQPELIVLGMGMPRQEQVAAVLRAHLQHPCLIVCGGAILDFMGGKTRRAPVWMRQTGMEWAFRLAIEPRRLFYRYVIGNPLFLSRALRLASGQQRA